MKDNDKKIEQVATASLVPYAKNAKKHDAAQVAAIAGSIREFGFNNPVLIDADNGIIAGHGRVLAAHQLGLEDVPCLRLTHLSDPQKRAYILADNRLAELGGGWDADMLAAELEALSADGITMEEIGFDADALEELGASVEPEGNPEADAEPQIDKAEELRAKWGVEPGQLWELGDHRLLCGDSTKKEDVERVMGGVKADAVVTDPPYGVGIQYATFTDTETNTEKTVEGFMPHVLKMNVPTAITPGVPVMWEYPQPAWVMVWVHPAPVGGCSWGFNGVNPILVYGKDPYLAAGLGRRPDHIVMAADREGVDGHPTPKPIKVWLWLVERLSPKRGQVIFEPFNGSGTTIIACEQLGRKARAIEISPAYVAVALQRWADATGKTPKLVS